MAALHPARLEQSTMYLVFETLYFHPFPHITRALTLSTSALSNMRELITFSVGQAGTQVSTEFWNLLLQEHGLDAEGRHTGGDETDQQLAKIAVFFDQSGQQDKFVPRSLVVDLEPGTIDAVRSSRLGKLYRPDNLIHGDSGAGNVWAKGHYTVSALVAIVRQSADRSDMSLLDRKEQSS